MCSQCEKCGRFTICYTRSTGGYWGRPIDLCFNCLSVHDQKEIRAREQAKEASKEPL